MLSVDGSLYLGFNSKLVRLKAAEDALSRRLQQQFQFQTGAIKSYGRELV